MTTHRRMRITEKRTEDSYDKYMPQRQCQQRLNKFYKAKCDRCGIRPARYAHPFIRHLKVPKDSPSQAKTTGRAVKEYLCVECERERRLK